MCDHMYDDDDGEYFCGGCSCHLGHAPCTHCTDHCGPAEPEPCNKCGCDLCGCTDERSALREEWLEYNI